MRDRWSSSVGPTVSVSMLKPRRAKSPAMRVRTPGLFSTRMVRTCLRPVRMPPAASRSSRLMTSCLVPGSPIALALHVARGGARRDHRIDVLLFGHRDVDDDWARRLERLAHLLDERRLVGAAHARAAEALGHLDEVRPAPARDLGVATVPEQLLPLA